MNLRRMNSADVPVLVRLSQSVMNEAFSEKSFNDVLYKENYVNLVVTEDSSSEPIGYCICSFATSESELLQIAIRNDKQRNGHAKALISLAIRELSKFGVKTVFLEVRESNDSAIYLYKKFGFKEVGNRPDFYKNPNENALILRMDFDHA